MSEAKENRQFIHKIKSKRKSEIDKMFHRVHEQVFKDVDCLTCARCCKTTGPRLLMKDIIRIAKALNMKPNAFISAYVRSDEEHDYVFKTMPCPFLEKDNTCIIYDVRPKACRTYPHTDRINQKQLLRLHVLNADICPAVNKMFSRLKKNTKI